MYPPSFLDQSNKMLQSVAEMYTKWQTKFCLSFFTWNWWLKFTDQPQKMKGYAIKPTVLTFYTTFGNLVYDISHNKDGCP